MANQKKKEYDLEFNRNYTKQCNFRLSRISQQREIEIFESIPDKAGFFVWAINQWANKQEGIMTFREVLQVTDPYITVTLTIEKPDGSHESGTYTDAADALTDADEVLDLKVKEIGTYTFGNDAPGLYVRCEKEA